MVMGYFLVALLRLYLSKHPGCMQDLSGGEGWCEYPFLEGMSPEAIPNGEAGLPIRGIAGPVAATYAAQRNGWAQKIKK